jgi:hypothetical protein
MQQMSRVNVGDRTEGGTWGQRRVCTRAHAGACVTPASASARERTLGVQNFAARVRRTARGEPGVMLVSLLAEAQ